MRSKVIASLGHETNLVKQTAEFSCRIIESSVQAHTDFASIEVDIQGERTDAGDAAGERLLEVPV